VSIGHRRFRVGIYWYVDIGTDGRSDPAYVKQESDASDGNWWASLDQVDGDEVIRGGKPEYRQRLIFGFQYRGIPLDNPKGVAILWEETGQTFKVSAIIPRINNNRHEWQVKAQLEDTSLQFATYSDGYYYAD
jgi:hypothetical protein